MELVMEWPLFTLSLQIPFVRWCNWGFVLFEDMRGNYPENTYTNTVITPLFLLFFLLYTSLDVLSYKRNSSGKAFTDISHDIEEVLTNR